MSSQTTRLSAQDFKRAVALQFASRPTLRQVVGRKVLQLLVERHPKLSTVRPLLADAEPLRLLIPQPGPGNAQLSVPLLQVLLQAVLDGTALNLETLHEQDHGLTFVEPYRFEGSDGFEFIALKGITDSINDLLLELPYHFQQAQIDYWSGVSSAGVSRDRWLQQTLKSALLRNLPLQGLGDPQTACIHGLLKGGAEQPSVFTVEVQLEANGQSFLRMLPNLLVVGEWDEVINSDSLNNYLKVLDTLIDMAQEEMAVAIREAELSDPVQPKAHLYRRRTGKHRVVKTHNGRSVIGEEVQVDGHDVVQQKDPSGTKVLKTFRKKQGVWVEDDEEPVDEPQPSDNSHDAGAARSVARKVLGQVEPTLKLAQRYIGKDEPIGMQSIVEGLVERLKEASEALDSTGVAAEFGTKLSDAIERLENTQHDLLTSYYLTTSFPTATGLRFLFKEKQISILPTTRRKMLSANDYLDIYEIHRLPSRGNAKGTGIWEAHFHYPDATGAARQFAKGHLKIWSQRKIGQKAQMEAVRGNSRELLAVYRGNLVLSEVEGIIPFD